MASAQPAGGEPLKDPSWTFASGRSLTLFPSGDIYPVYVADPHRPTTILEEAFVIGGGIPATESLLTRLAAGSRFGAIRFEPARPEGRWWQVSLEAGLDALFDSRNRLDVVGWDGNYGVTVTTASGGRLALKFAALHVSAHLGDEYLERTGRERLNYTREEVSVGAAWRWSPRWRVYGETGVAYKMGDPALEPWRVQAGAEYDTGPGPCGQRFACYGATDLLMMQERQWRRDVTGEFGIRAGKAGRTYRIFLQLRDGRPTANEFFLDSVATFSLGLKVDL